MGQTAKDERGPHLRVCRIGRAALTRKADAWRSLNPAHDQPPWPANTSTPRKYPRWLVVSFVVYLVLILSRCLSLVRSRNPTSQPSISSRTSSVANSSNSYVYHIHHPYLINPHLDCSSSRSGKPTRRSLSLCRGPHIPHSPRPRKSQQAPHIPLLERCSQACKR